MALLVPRDLKWCFYLTLAKVSVCFHYVVGHKVANGFRIFDWHDCLLHLFSFSFSCFESMSSAYFAVNYEFKYHKLKNMIFYEVILLYALLSLFHLYIKYNLKRYSLSLCSFSKKT